MDGTWGPDQNIPPVDNILRALNPTGRYQILHILALMLATPAAAFQVFSNVFTGKDLFHLKITDRSNSLQTHSDDSCSKLKINSVIVEGIQGIV